MACVIPLGENHEGFKLFQFKFSKDKDKGLFLNSLFSILTYAWIDLQLQILKSFYSWMVSAK